MGQHAEIKEIKTLIIDNDATAIKTLRNILGQNFPHITVIGEAMSVKEALRAVEKFRPDLIFLDVEMLPFSGFDFIELSRQHQFGVMITTAYPQYAIEAINLVQPWAYLLKPYNIDKLTEAVDTARKKISGSGEVRPVQGVSINHGIILQDSRRGNIVLRIRDILYCKSDGSALEIFAQRNGKTEKFMLYRTLKELDAQLPELLFCRVHHSFIVNLSFIERFEISKQTRTVYLSSGNAIPISIQKTEQFERKIAAFLQ